MTMAGETQVTVIGTLTSDPELKYVPSGSAVANFTLASTPRSFDRQTQEWKDGETLFLRCAAWRQLAEHAAESLSQGTRVIAQGRLRQRSYDDKEGMRRTVVELELDEVGPSLKFATASVNKAQRREDGPAASAPAGRRPASGGPGGGDPWATPADIGARADDPPF